MKKFKFKNLEDEVFEVGWNLGFVVETFMGGSIELFGMLFVFFFLRLGCGCWDLSLWI